MNLKYTQSPLIVNCELSSNEMATTVIEGTDNSDSADTLMSPIRQILITRVNYRKFDLCNSQLALVALLSLEENIDYYFLPSYISVLSFLNL